MLRVDLLRVGTREQNLATSCAHRNSYHNLQRERSSVSFSWHITGSTIQTNANDERRKSKLLCDKKKNRFLGLCFNAVHAQFHWLAYRKVVYKSRTWIEAALEYKLHFLQTQIAHKPHSKRSLFLKMAALYRPCRAKFYHILQAKMFYILKQFCDIHKFKVRSCFPITCHITPYCFHGFWNSENCI